MIQNLNFWNGKVLINPTRGEVDFITEKDSMNT